MGLIHKIAFLFTISVTLAKHENVFTRLHNELFEERNYNKDTIPMSKPAAEDNTNALNLALGITIISMDIRPGRRVLSANTWLRSLWTDYRLVWDPENYEGLKSIRVPPSQVWKPDLSIFNGANFGCGSFEDRFSSSPSLAIIHANGDVLWMPPLPMEVNCNTNDVMETGEGDHTQECNIRIGSWTYDGNHLNLTAFGGSDVLDLSEMSSNSAYLVTEQKGEALTNSYYGCCDAPYPAMDYRFTVRRAGKHQLGIQTVASMVQSSGGKQGLEYAEKKVFDPSLLNGVMGLVKEGGDTGDGSCLKNASILFLNCNLLLEYRKNWRFLYSTLSHTRSLEEMMSKISYKGPTIILIKDTEGNMFGAHASTSWFDTEGGWVGNGDCFIFSIQPQMAIFHSTGKDENFQLLSNNSLAMGGQPGNFGLELNSDLTSGSSSGSIETFHTIRLSSGSTFEIDHVEVWGLGPEPDERTERANTKPRQPNLKTRGSDVDMLNLESQIV